MRGDSEGGADAHASSDATPARGRAAREPRRLLRAGAVAAAADPAGAAPAAAADRRGAAARADQALRAPAGVLRAASPARAAGLYVRADGDRTGPLYAGGARFGGAAALPGRTRPVGRR